MKVQDGCRRGSRCSRLPRIEGLWETRLRHESGGGVETTWFEVQVDEGWLAAYRLMPEKGYAWPVELRLLRGTIDDPHRIAGEPSLGAAPTQITARLLREVRVADHMKLAREALVGEGGQDHLAISALWGFLRADLKPPSGSGRRGKTDEDYARLAASYVEMVKGGSHSPLKMLAEQSEELGTFRSVEFFRNEVNEARRRGLLTSIEKGRAGGELTEKAHHLLRSVGEAD